MGFSHTEPTAHTFTKHQRVFLRDVGKDERWLQERIVEDTSILGLGDLVVFNRERTQRLGGRLDFLLLDRESETMYEVEVMRGATDESHIIRTIEYWDIESRRYRDHEHRAVIVAEDITNRFFNVIWLLSRSLPIIALQLNALIVDGKLLLHFTKVLDFFEAPDINEENQWTPADRAWWEKQSPGGVQLFDAILTTLEKEGLRLTPNFNRRDWIGIDGRTLKNIVRIDPGKQEVCRMSFDRLKALSEPDYLEARRAWEMEGAELKDKSDGRFSVKLTPTFVRDHAPFLGGQLRRIFEVFDGE
ncbi:MAG TPA: hypothetical protein VKT81_12555 [Bryobacteraceae bacterium]|nr:hypothetical protein [Bryobacteraceae bacterium]